MNLYHPTYDNIHQACTTFTGFCNNYGFEFEAILALARGGLIPGVMLSHMMNIPLIPANYSSKAGKGDDQNHNNLLPFLQPKKSILIVDDICDSGHTLREVVDHYALRGVSVYSYVLYFKQHQGIPPIVPDFRWKDIPHDAPWCTFPWEKNELTDRANE